MGELHNATERESGFYSALDLVATPVAVVDLGFRIEFVNRALCAMYSRSSETLVGRGLHEIVHPDDYAVGADLRDGFESVTGDLVVHRRIVRSDGAVFNIRVTLAARRDDQGETVGFVMSLEDVTQLAAARADAHEAEQRQQEILEQLAVAVMLQIDGRVSYANRAALELMGVGDLGALAERMAAFAHVRADERQLLIDRVAGLERGEQPDRESHWWIVRPDGSQRLVEWRSLPTRVRGEKCLLFVANDLTEITASRDALAVSEAHQRTIIDAMGEGVIVVDQDGVCTDANHTAARILRLQSTAPLLGAPADALPLVDLGAHPVERELHPVWRAVNAGELSDAETWGVVFGSTVRWMRVSTHPMLSPSTAKPTGAVVTFTDTTDEFAARRAVETSEARFRRLAANAPVGIFETDREDACTFVNQRWLELTGLSAAAAAGGGWSDAVHPEDRATVLDQWTCCVAAGERFVAEFRYRQPGGQIVPVHAEADPIIDPDGLVSGYLGTTTDLSLQVSLRERLAASERRFRDLADHSPDVVVRLGLRPFHIDYLGPAIVALTGHEAARFVQRPARLRDHIHPDDLDRVSSEMFSDAPPALSELRMIHADGTVRDVEMRNHVIFGIDGSAVEVEIALRDVSAARQKEDHLDHLAHRDGLTALMNRHAWRKALAERLAAGEPTAVLFVDLDGFKSINDTYGHEAGDRVLLAVAATIRDHVRQHDVVARLGGDEFVVITPPDNAVSVAQRLLDTLDDPITDHHGTPLRVGASIGISFATHVHTDRVDPEELLEDADRLLREADHAMYEAKRQGKHQIGLASNWPAAAEVLAR